jgi:hypothetical protein
MSWSADALDKGAAATKDTRAAALMRKIATSIRGRRAPYEEELISRLSVLAALCIELRIDTVCDIREACAVWSKEAGGYMLTRNVNDDGTADLGWIQINDLWKQPDRIRLSRIESLVYFRDVIAPAFVKQGKRPLDAFNASNVDWAAHLPYVDEAFRRVTKPHPTKPAGLLALGTPTLRS